MASSLICAWIRLEPADREAFLDFHDREHIPERLAVPGFRHGRRFVSTIDPNRFLLVYEVDSIGVLTSPAYLDRQNNPTEWTRSCIPMIRAPQRLAVNLDMSLGQARGGCVTLMRLRDGYDIDFKVQIAALMAQSGVVAVHLGRIDLAASNIATVERRALGSPDNSEGLVLLIEATEVATAAAAVAKLIEHTAIPSYEIVECWRLQSSLTARPLG